MPTGYFPANPELVKDKQSKEFFEHCIKNDTILNQLAEEQANKISKWTERFVKNQALTPRKPPGLLWTSNLKVIPEEPSEGKTP